MRPPIRRAILATAILALMAATASPGVAGTIVSFSYSGNGGPDNEGFDTKGTGSFSFPTGLSGVGQGNLTSFTFTMTETQSPLPGINTVTFGLSDLTSFSASLGPDGTVTGLSLTTGPVEGSDTTTYPRLFVISSLGTGNASTLWDFHGLTFGLTSGTATITAVAVPEPSSLVLAVAGGLIVAAGWSRRRHASATA
jgi:hypothetical protein